MGRGQDQLSPAVDHHRLVPACPLIPHQVHEVQEVGGVVRDTMVRPGHVLDLDQLPVLAAL